jgi:histidinol phosphatase-like PHP family hydrolase
VRDNPGIVALSNADLSELMARTAEDETPGSNRDQALRRAARAAYSWPEEAAALVGEGRSLTELRTVGPRVAGVLLGWLSADEPIDVPEPPELRRGFLTLSEVRETLAENPGWSAPLRGDLQMHTTYSDGKAPVREMAGVCREEFGYQHVLITDHSHGLRIARGMDEPTLRDEIQEIGALNDELERAGHAFRVLPGLEMNLSPEGQGDMSREALAPLSVVLGAFHSRLRETEDQTERYLAAIRNPVFHVLAHPRGRRWGVRVGLRAEWDRVFAEAARWGKAVEIDAHPDRQDLDIELLSVARQAGTWISIGTDAHHPRELANMGYGLAAAIRAEIPRDRILNFLSTEDLLAWAAHPR